MYIYIYMIMLVDTQVVVAFVVSSLLICYLWRMEATAWPLGCPSITSATAKELSPRSAVARDTSQHGRGGSRSRGEGGERRLPASTMTRERRPPLDASTMARGRCALMFLLVFGQAISVAAAHVWPQQSYALAIFSACMTLNFGMSHTINGLTKLQVLSLLLILLALLVENQKY